VSEGRQQVLGECCDVDELLSVQLPSHDKVLVQERLDQGPDLTRGGEDRPLEVSSDSFPALSFDSPNGCHPRRSTTTKRSAAATHPIGTRDSERVALQAGYQNETRRTRGHRWILQAEEDTRGSTQTLISDSQPLKYTLINCSIQLLIPFIQSQAKMVGILKKILRVQKVSGDLYHFPHSTKTSPRSPLVAFSNETGR
jgi:hypothetical protein